MSIFQDMKRMFETITPLAKAIIAILTVWSSIITINFLKLINENNLFILYFSLLVITALFCWLFYQNKIETNRFPKMAAEIHNINHFYRDAVATILSDKNNAGTQREKLLVVCAMINKLFSLTIGGKDCVVTIYFIHKSEAPKESFIKRFVRHEVHARGQQPDDFQYGMGKENTAFYQALNSRDSSENSILPPCYFSTNINLDKNYRSERENYLKSYQAQIVVPIRHKENNKDTNDVIGFLGIDTMHTNVFSQPYHLQLALAFADQLYSYLVLARKFAIRET